MTIVTDSDTEINHRCDNNRPTSGLLLLGISLNVLPPRVSPKKHAGPDMRVRRPQTSGAESPNYPFRKLDETEMVVGSLPLSHACLFKTLEYSLTQRGWNDSS